MADPILSHKCWLNDPKDLAVLLFVIPPPNKNLVPHDVKHPNRVLVLQGCFIVFAKK